MQTDWPPKVVYELIHMGGTSRRPCTGAFTWHT